MDSSKKSGGGPTEYSVGYCTSATGTTIYRRHASSEQFRGTAFIVDVGSKPFHRKALKTDDVVYSAVREDADTGLLTSMSNWFRPVSFWNAPDGSLFNLDRYRETIEQPHSSPEHIKAFLDLFSVDDRGRN